MRSVEQQRQTAAGIYHPQPSQGRRASSCFISSSSSPQQNNKHPPLILIKNDSNSRRKGMGEKESYSTLKPYPTVLASVGTVDGEDCATATVTATVTD
mmetsp:Transcript_46102/g.51564  ORF Transcript_46102/g.51564 Transcript_46102/m.51564 type:complete len:98 (-) Transcript_46102:136-429(-)